MKQHQAIEGLQQQIAYAERKIPELIERIRFKRKTSNMWFCYAHLAGMHQTLAMRAKYPPASE